MKTNPNLLKTDRYLYLRWAMWICLVLLHLITTFHRVSFNVVADLLTAEFVLTGAGLGNLAAAYTYMYVIMQIPGGMLVDRLGPRRIAFLTGVLMTAGSILIGVAPTSAVVFLGRLLLGFGGSVILINIFKFQASWFSPARFATLSGLAILFSGSGALLGATPLALSVSLIGWRSSFVAAGFITGLVAIISWLLVRNSPGDCGRNIDAFDGNIDRSESEKNGQYSLARIVRVLTNKRLLPPFFINFGVFGGFIVFSGTWGVSYLVHIYGLDVAQASIYMMLVYLSYMAGAPLAGWLSDLTGSRKIPALVMTFSSVLFWLFLFCWPGGILPLGFIYFLCVLLGLGAASSILSFPMAREASPPGFTGSVTAAVNLGVFLGLAIQQPLFGYILDLGWAGTVIDGARIYTIEAYRYGFLVCLLFAFTAFAAALLYRES